MKEWQRWVGNHFLALIIGIIVGIATGILVGEYSLWRAEELKRIEKTVLKERMMKENEILEKRYKED
jgi:predicted small secreted protein